MLDLRTDQRSEGREANWMNVTAMAAGHNRSKKPPTFGAGWALVANRQILVLPV
jgi:phage baseplate assembly protein gpV